LFHTAYTPGLLPSRGFPSLKSVAPLDARSPLDVASWFPPTFLRQAAVQMTFPAQSSSGVFPFSESVHTVPTVKFITAADPLLSFLPSKGLSRYAIETPSRLFLSRTFSPVHLTRKPASPLPVPQSLTHASLGLSPKRLPSFLGSLPLSLFTPFRSPPPLWLIVSPQVPEYVTAS
jgi:hypothetical protein